jgi:hypothetical protein
MTQIPVGPQVSQVWAGQGPVLLANQDLASPVTVGTIQNISMDASNTDVIPPLGSIGYGGSPTLYAIAPAGTAALLAIAGGTSWAPSPADVALQISELGLAKNTTVAALPGQIQTLGAPPYVPNIKSHTVVNQGPTVPTTFYTFKSAGRLWSAHLSFAMSTNSSGTATNQAYARLITGSGTTLMIIETSVGGAFSTNSGDGDLNIGGLVINEGDQLQIDVNNGVNLGGQGVMRASCVALVSVP